MFRIIIERLHQGPETLEIDVAPEELDLRDEMFEFPARVTGAVEFKLVGRDVRAVGGMDTDVATACVRCLDPVKVHLRVPVDETWLWHDPASVGYDEPTEDQMLAEYYEGDMIDPTATLRELIMAELPDLPHCDEACKGLCPGCGSNLNREPCRCPPKPAEPEAASEWKKAIQSLKRR